MKLHRSFHTVKVEKQAHNYYYPSLKTELSLERIFYFSFAELGFHTKAITALSTQTEVKKSLTGWWLALSLPHYFEAPSALCVLFVPRVISHLLFHYFSSLTQSSNMSALSLLMTFIQTLCNASEDGERPIKLVINQPAEKDASFFYLDELHDYLQIYISERVSRASIWHPPWAFTLDCAGRAWLHPCWRTNVALYDLAPYCQYQ